MPSTPKKSALPPVRVRPADRTSVTDAVIPAHLDTTFLKTMSLRVPRRGGERRLTGAEVERALISGDHARTLETYFGEAEYAELRQLAAHATRRTRQPGPRVLILPGILGSMLAEVGDRDTDTIWVDFFDILRGRLSRLTLPDTRRIQAVDVHLPSYLKLKLWLQGEGFDADFHPFDWRLSISELGRQLAARIAAEPAGEVSLVAHSMGGLVARTAFHYGAGDKVQRLVMLGTPNYGSFAPAMVYRSVYPFLNKIAALDLKHDATELAGKIFNTHPGLTQMLPQKAKFSAIDLYDLQKWPVAGARPLKALLDSAQAAQQKFAIVPEKFVMIAGVDRETTVGARVDPKHGDEFLFERSNAGDGTVPLDFAVLPDVLTYYHAEEHGALPKNPTVHKAVVEILRRGSTTLLADRWDRSRGDARIEVRESDLRARALPPATRNPGDFSASDLRSLFAEFAAPSTAGAPPAPPSAPASASASADAVSDPFEALIVGRRRQRRIDVRLARGSLTQVKSRAYLLGIFQNVAPGGAAHAIDEQMEGTLSEFRQRRMFSADAGEVLIIPANRTKLAADYVVFVGLGHFDTFNLQVLETAAENVARTLARTHIEEFATVPIGAGTGFDVEQAMRALLRGFFRGLDDSDRQHAFRGVTFCELEEARFAQLKWTLYRLWSTPLCAEVEVTLGELHLPPAPTTRHGGADATPPCVYLNVRTRQVDGDSGQIVFESALLTTGAKATVLSGNATVSTKQLAQHLAQIETSSFTAAALPRFGTALARLVLNDAVAAGLEGCAGNHVVVVHDAEASRVPWETICLGGNFPALVGGMSRRYIADNLSVAKWLEQRRRDEWLDVLLVVNPTLDLQGAEEEGERVATLFNASQQVHLTIVHGTAATRARLRTEFGSGKYDILHYAGHAYFDPQHISRSGIVCADGYLTGAELVEIGNLPSLVFFNACESARIRKLVRDTGPFVSRDVHERIERNAGLAEAFMRGGVANYLGTYWPVGDAAAEDFARVFYERILAGATLADALATARRKVNTDTKSQDWADYVFYGSLDFTVKKPGAK